MNVINEVELGYGDEDGSFEIDLHAATTKRIHNKEHMTHTSHFYTYNTTKSKKNKHLSNQVKTY
jgi:hypothetical protein